MEQCHISCMFECITFTNVCVLTQGSASAKEETSTITSCLCGMMYVNDNLWLAMLTFSKAQAVSGIYFTRTSCCVIGKSLCKFSISSVTKVCCCSFFLSCLDKLQCFNARTTWHVDWNLQAGMKSQMSKKPIALRVYCMMCVATKAVPQACNQENVADPLHGPIKETFHLEQPWLEMLTVRLLCRAPVPFLRGKASTHQSSSTLIRSLDGCLGLC